MVFAPDAEFYSPYGPPSIGRAAPEDTHREWVEDGAENKVVSAGSSGQIRWCLVEYSEGSTGNGTSLNVTERQSDSTWLITYCSVSEVPQTKDNQTRDTTSEGAKRPNRPKGWSPQAPRSWQ